MSAAMESRDTRKSAEASYSPRRSVWQRLLWKDAREILPIWITLLLAAVLCLAVSFVGVNSEDAHVAPLYVSGHTFISLISVITGVFLFASEDENRTLHLLRNLPLTPRQIVLQKLLLGAAGIISLSCCIATVTMGLAHFAQSIALGSHSTFGFAVTNVFLLPMLLFVLGLLSSMLSRSYFYGVLIAGIIGFAVIAVLEPTWLGANESSLTDRGQTRWLWVGIAVLTGHAAAFLYANRWVEERAISKPSLNWRVSEATQSIGQSASSGSNPLPNLLWQSWRQSCVLLGCYAGLTIIGWIAINVWVTYETSAPKQSTGTSTGVTFLTLAWAWGMTAVFASSVFLDDKRRSNFLFFQQNQERARWLWLSRLLPYWIVAITLLVLWSGFICGVEINLFHHHRQPNVRTVQLFTSISEQIPSLSTFVPILGVVGIIGIGQYFSMFIRNPILAFVFTGIISGVFAALLSYAVYINENLWLYVVPTIAAGYAATWWRSKPWLSTASSHARYLIPLLAPVVVFAVMSAAFINHRETEFSNVAIEPNNFAHWSNGALLDQRNLPMTRQALQRVEFGTDAQRQRAATLYRDAIDLYDGDLLSIDEALPLFVSDEETEDFVAKNEVAIDKILEASLLPTCAPFLSEYSLQRQRERYWLKRLAFLNARHKLESSNLPAAKSAIDAYDRVTQRVNEERRTSRYDSGYYRMLIEWAEHPKQNSEAIVTAIAILEGRASDARPTKIISANGEDITSDALTGLVVSHVYRELGGERAFMNLQYEVESLQANDDNHRLVGLPTPFTFAPWEYQRMLQVAQRRAIDEFELELMLINGALPHDSLVERQHIERMINALPVSIPPDDDRFNFFAYSVPWQIASVEPDRVTWRRYTLLRLALAAYNLEHEELPDDLLELRKYFTGRLPTTIDGMMFAWFKDGLSSDLVSGSNYVLGPDQQTTYRKLADGQRPILLPFSLRPNIGVPDSRDIGEGKRGIEIDDFQFGGSLHRPRFHLRNEYQLKWNISR